MEIITNQESNGTLVLEIQVDHLDASNVTRLKNELIRHMDGHAKVVLDMGHLDFVDSSGLGALLSCLRLQNSRQGDLRLSGMSRPVRGLFELMRMHRVFGTFANTEQAVRSYDEV